MTPDAIESFMYGACMLLAIDDEGLNPERTNSTDRDAMAGACDMIIAADVATPIDMALRNFAIKTSLVIALPRGSDLAALAVREWHQARNEFTALQLSVG
jgi:hypothetical protein